MRVWRRKSVSVTLSKEPSKFLGKTQVPATILLSTAIWLLRGYRFGAEDYMGFNGNYMLWGLLLTAIAFVAGMFIIGIKNVGRVLRFEILYLYFVPHLSIMYFERLSEINALFDLREDLTKDNWQGAVGMWLPEVLPVFQVLIPVLLLMLGARGITAYSERNVFWFKRAYSIAFSVAAILFIMTLPFPTIANLCTYIAYYLLTCVVCSLWEDIRLMDSMEPSVMVSWAEIFLYTALLLQGIVQSVVI